MGNNKNSHILKFKNIRPFLCLITDFINIYTRLLKYPHKIRLFIHIFFKSIMTITPYQVWLKCIIENYKWLYSGLAIPVQAAWSQLPGYLSDTMITINWNRLVWIDIKVCTDPANLAASLYFLICHMIHAMQKNISMRSCVM